MITLRSSCEDEMLLEFLAMEFYSERFGQDLRDILAETNADESLILRGDYHNAAENTLRRSIMGKFRGYGKDDGVFERFPKNIRWIWARMQQEDFSKVRYITYSYWDMLSNYTGSPIEAGQAVLNGKIVFDVPNTRFWNTLEALQNSVVFPALILLCNAQEELFYILEGHLRATAYGMAPELFRDVPAIVGYCDAQQLLSWYGEMSCAQDYL